MTPKKKTLYEILAVAENASDAEIQVGYDIARDRLQLQKDRISPDDFDFKLKVIQMAFTTLSTPSSRDVYDARLAASPRLTPSPPPAASAAPALALVPQEVEADALSLRAEAMALRADAMTMRADALALRSGGAPLPEPRGFSADRPRHAPGPASSSRKILMAVGTVFAIVMVTQATRMVMGNRQAHVAAATAAQANEKVVLQEYYQTHGVRPASIAEMELLEAAQRRQEAAQRTAERDKNKAEQDARRFEEESRRRAAQVSESLRLAELEASRQARREDEQRERQQREDARYAEEKERQRIERLMAEWREVLRR